MTVPINDDMRLEQQVRDHASRVWARLSPEAQRWLGKIIHGARQLTPVDGEWVPATVLEEFLRIGANKLYEVPGVVKVRHRGAIRQLVPTAQGADVWTHGRPQPRSKTGRR